MRSDDRNPGASEARGEDVSRRSAEHDSGQVAEHHDVAIPGLAPRFLAAVQRATDIVSGLRKPVIVDPFAGLPGRWPPPQTFVEEQHESRNLLR